VGAAQLLEELAIQFDIIDETIDISSYRLIILPESFRPAPDFEKNWKPLLPAAGRSSPAAKPFFRRITGSPPVSASNTKAVTNFTRTSSSPGRELAAGLEPGNEYVIYEQGLRIKAGKGKTVLRAHPPYFARKGDVFCSHRYTPSSGETAYPAAVKNGKILYFFCLIFRYVSPQPSTLSRNKPPVRDVILKLNLPRKIYKAVLVPEGGELSLDQDNNVTIPEVDGYAILELPYQTD
jgi:hypothetical protein